MPCRFGLQVLALLALLVSPLFSSAQEPAYGRPESHVGIGVKFSTMERLLLRLFEEEEDLSIYILVDCSKSMMTCPEKQTVIAIVFPQSGG